MAMPDAPSDIRNSLLLMDWARKLQAVPRLGSPPLEKFAELLEILGDGAKSLVTELKAELKTAETELRKLREANWKTMNLQNKEPKN